tara:strand:- start:2065 stop:2256 length:192 start_codon:yes stop_codon:yes gene_type:complete
MKKIVALLMILSVVFLLGGCEVADSGDVEKVKDESQAQETVQDVSSEIDELANELAAINEELG